MQAQTIYIPLTNEGTDAWRPVTAEVVSPAVFRLSSQMGADEEWEYAPGQAVAVELRRFTDGKEGLVAVQIAPYARIDLNEDEFRIVNNALNEICNGIDLAGEFDTRIGGSLEEARTLLTRLRSFRVSRSGAGARQNDGQ